MAWMLSTEKHAGVGRVSEELLNGLVKRGHDVVTMQLNNTNHLAYLKYLLWEIPHNLPLADVYIAQSPMETIFLPKDRTICIAHDLIPLLHPKLAGANMNGNLIKTFLGSRFYLMGANAASQCKRIVCNSSQTRDELKKYFNIPDERLKVINLGVRPDLMPQPKPDNVFRVGYLGQLDRRKRVNLLIDAFKETDIKGELVIAGSGPDRSKLEALAGNDQRIKFLGFVPDSKLNDFYNSLDLFTFPSAAEGWGIPITEAMACKKPVLILHDSFIPEELKAHTYECFPEVFSNMLNNLYITWMSSNGWRGLASDAPKKIPHAYIFAKYLKWDNFVTGIEETIKEVVSERKD